MSQIRSSSDRATRRCLRACSRCRDMKVRCSGTFPCARCERKREACFFKPEDSRVTVSQSYLQSLENRARENHRPALRQSPPQRDPEVSQTSVISPQQPAFQSDQFNGRSTGDGGPFDWPTHGRDNPPIGQGSQRGTNSLAESRARSIDIPLPEQARIIHQNEPVIENPSSPLGSSVTEFSRNPLVDSGETFTRDPHGKYWYMGPTSSWAFCRRVLAIIGSRMPKPEPPVFPWDLETLDLTWNPIGLNEQPDVDNLPSHDYAIFLASTVKYYLGSLHEIIDHDSFHGQLERFYEDPATEASRSRFWYSQFLLVLAFGEAFTLIGSPKSVPGINYASRALSLIPSIIPVEKDSLAAVEALCLAALYLQAVDLRLMAFQLIGQALRLCVIEGWHRHMASEDVGVRHSQRCNTIFWTAYIIDREFGTLVGAPSSIRDEDITTKLPSEVDDSARAAALTLQIQLARLIAKILTGVYGVDRNFDGTLLSDTQSVLHSIAVVSRDLSAYLENKIQGVDIRTSKIATRLILSYHHCVVLTTRPLVMCVLQRRLARSDLNRSIPDGPISLLLQSCAYSALNILKTLKALGDRNLLDSFLPFQLETAFSSAFLLYVLEALSPGFVQDKSWLATAHGIFDIMIARGSPAARLRKREIQRLEQIMVSYLQEGHQENDPVPSPSEETVLQEDAGIVSRSMIDAESMDEISPWGLLGEGGGFTLSPTEILNLAEELRGEDFIVRG